MALHPVCEAICRLPSPWFMQSGNRLNLSKTVKQDVKLWTAVDFGLMGDINHGQHGS